LVQKIRIVRINGVEKLTQMFSPAGEDALLVLDKRGAIFGPDRMERVTRGPEHGFDSFKKLV